MSESDAGNGTKVKRERSPSFPYIDLSTSIDHLAKLYAAAKMNEVRVPDVAEAWGMTAKSGSLLRYVSALGQFGLVDTSGSGEARRIKVSVDGRRILEDDRPGVREELCSLAALKPKIIQWLYHGSEDAPAWGQDRPNDSIAESSLKFDLNFTSEAARRFLTVYDATIKHVIDSKNVIEGVDIDGEGALESGVETDNQAEPPMQQQHTPVSEQPTLPTEATLNAINFKSDGAGTVTISATLDAEGLDLLQKKIEALKLLIN